MLIWHSTRLSFLNMCFNKSSQHEVCVCLPLQDLYAAGEGKFGTDEEKFITILGNRSAEHLRKGEFASLPVPAHLDVVICCVRQTLEKKKENKKVKV